MGMSRFVTTQSVSVNMFVKFIQITCKSFQKSSKCQNFLRVWHLVILRADQLKKPPCNSHLSQESRLQ